MDQEQHFKEAELFLQPHYLLRIRPENGGASGEVWLRNKEGHGADTHVFDVPRQESSEELKRWAERAIRAYEEG
ncbi:hypothetical protein [Paenibacillus ehimensis]|uniref:Uncharacterized protein n=1 Tax=Paenibacillus ehimensis TaxID=79264 RepID=A0ABT8VKL5_9BACL|nr:hypothetical protein [Paenibacillus ehimensis]MDO3681481.1 hypothetical protein [Paenibacillus ehimensis]MEC0212029.1 hypothetical protein [Paenibacillus ehimensis]